MGPQQTNAFKNLASGSTLLTTSNVWEFGSTLSKTLSNVWRFGPTLKSLKHVDDLGPNFQTLLKV